MNSKLVYGYSFWHLGKRGGGEAEKCKGALCTLQFRKFLIPVELVNYCKTLHEFKEFTAPKYIP